MKKWGIGAHVLLIVFALSGCVDECVFALAIAESSESLFVGRYCGRDESSLTRHQLRALDADPISIKAYGYSRLALDREERRLVAVRSYGTVDVYSVDGGSLLGDVSGLPGLAGEVVFTLDASAVWVALWGRYSGVALIDFEHGLTRATIPLAGDPVSLVYADGDNAVFIASSSPGRLVKLHTSQFVEIATATTSGALDLLLLSAHVHVAVLEDSANRIVVRDAETLAERATLSIGAEARQLEMSRDQKWMAVTERGGRQLRIFDVESLSERGVVPLEGEPEALALSNDGRAFVAFTDRDQVVVIDLATAAVTGEVEL
jgi:DNA-binding beta-propeller fold protein YncE